MADADEVRRLYEMAYDIEHNIEQAEDFVAGKGLCLVRDYTWKERLEEAARRLEKAKACAEGLLEDIKRELGKEGARC